MVGVAWSVLLQPRVSYGLTSFVGWHSQPATDLIIMHTSGYCDLVRATSDYLYHALFQSGFVCASLC